MSPGTSDRSYKRSSVGSLLVIDKHTGSLTWKLRQCHKFPNHDNECVANAQVVMNECAIKKALIYVYLINIINFDIASQYYKVFLNIYSLSTKRGF